MRGGGCWVSIRTIESWQARDRRDRREVVGYKGRLRSGTGCRGNGA